MARASLLALIFLGAVEIYVTVLVAHLIGVPLTLAALFASTVAGLWLVRIQGRRAFDALRRAVGSGVPPDREVSDAALIFAGGALIAIPGFVTDVLGLCAVTPLTRPALRRVLGTYIRRRTAATAARVQRPGPRGPEEPPGKIIRGEVIRNDSARADTSAQHQENERPS